nr:MAG TPA: hypothetical protein [Caudoviricetes sp.]
MPSLLSPPPAQTRRLCATRKRKTGSGTSPTSS